MTAKKPFRVSTGDLVGELDPKRFGPCGKSVCILHEGSWLTPCEFRAKAKGSKKDSFMWKESIKASDLKKNLGYLIKQGILRQCEKDCKCTNCQTAKSRKSSGGSSNSSNSSGQPQMAPLNVDVDMSKAASSGGKDSDSDSGISNVSSSKNTEKSKSGPLPASPNQNSQKTTSPAKFTSSQLTTKSASTLPDYPFMVREAIVSVTSGMLKAASRQPQGQKGQQPQQGCSRLWILLYVLNKYNPAEDVKVVNEKIKGALRLLSSMEVIGTTNDDDDDDIMECENSVKTALINELNASEEPPQLAIRTGSSGSHGGGTAAKPAKSEKAAAKPAKAAAKPGSKESAAKSKPKAEAASNKSKGPMSDDPEVGFGPAQFYGGGKPAVIKPSDAAAAATAVTNPAAKAPATHRPKLSVKNSDKSAKEKDGSKKAGGEDQSSSNKKVKKAALSAAKENRDKVKTSKKVKKVVKDLAEGGGKKAKKAKGQVSGGGEKGENHGINKQPLKLSAALQSICGGPSELTRNEAIKGIWSYIKAKNLQDPNDKKTIHCDAKMRAMTKKETIQNSDIFAALSGHMERLEDLKKTVKKDAADSNKA